MHPDEPRDAHSPRLGRTEPDPTELDPTELDHTELDHTEPGRRGGICQPSLSEPVAPPRRTRPATELPAESGSEAVPTPYLCSEVQRFPAATVPPRHEETHRPETDRPETRRQETGAVGQGICFLLIVTLLFAAARFLLPTIVEEVRYSWHRGQLRAEYETSGEGLQNVSLDSLSQAYQMVTQRVGPSVVHIEVERRLTEEEEEIASLMRGGLGVPHASDQGSGVVVDEQGYVLTNEHVIAGGESIEVALSDGRRLPARVIGVDPLTDLAVLKVEADGLIPIVFGDSEEAHVGAPVWAVGSPFGLDRTITFGILSGKHRVVKASTRYQDFMQSDVAVNPGNSGGPLVDSRGELIGINTAIVGDTYRGVSFSIPSNVAERVYQRIRVEGVYHRGWLGVGLTEVPDELHRGPDHRVRGALVTDLAAADSPAARAGIEAGDLIKTVDGVTLTDMGHLMRVVGDLPAGVEIEMEIVRDGEPMQLAVTIGKRPSQYAPR